MIPPEANNMQAHKKLLEVCVDNVGCALAAQRGGAARIELCDNLREDGTTPSAGTIAVVRELLTIPVHVMIRPRGGDFVYTENELDVMRHDIEIAQSLGVDGVVFGILTEERRVDALRTSELVALAQPLDVTFHRAFDEVPDPVEALNILQLCGVRRVLTSGQKASASDAKDLLRRFADNAGTDMSIMPGGGVTLNSIPSLLSIPGIREIHVSSAVKRTIRRTTPNTGVAMHRSIVVAEMVAACVGAMESIDKQWH